MLLLATLFVTLRALGQSSASSPTIVAHESLITPAPIVWDIDELQRAWPTSDAVPIGSPCGEDYYPACECPGECSAMDYYGRSYCKFCPATPCPASCSSTSSSHWLCSACLCPATTGCPTLSCGNTCSTGVWQTTIYPGYECPYCSCSYTAPATPCPSISCSGPCRPGPQCGMTGYQTTTYLPGSSCPSCACTIGVVCSVLPCNGPCSTGSLSYTTDICAPPGCWGCSCHPVTTPCKTATGCTGQCEGGTLGMATVEGCSTRCSKYCACKSTTGTGVSITEPEVTATPTMTTVGQAMTGVVMVVGRSESGLKVEQRHTVFEPVMTTVVV